LDARGSAPCAMEALREVRGECALGGGEGDGDDPRYMAHDGFGTEPRYRIYANSIIFQCSHTLHTSHQLVPDTIQTHYYVPCSHGNHPKASRQRNTHIQLAPACRKQVSVEVVWRRFSHL